MKIYQVGVLCGLLSSLAGGMAPITSYNDVAALFSLSAQQMNERAAQIQKKLAADIATIFSLKPHERTFANTFFAYDNAIASAGVYVAVLNTLADLHPRASLRNEARVVATFVQDEISSYMMHPDLYRSYTEYYAHAYQKEKGRLSADEQRYIELGMEQLKKGGFDVLPDKKKYVQELSDKVGVLKQEFEQAIVAAKPTLFLTRDELAGVSLDMLPSAVEQGDGYLVPVADETVNVLCNQALLEATRKKVMHTYTNRAYPGNDKRLVEIVRLNNEIARTLGYKSAAAMELEDSMADTPERVLLFLNDLIAKIQPYAQKEFELLFRDLPKEVTLTDAHTMKPWDVGFVMAQYRKNNFGDMRQLYDYFDYESTITNIFSIYEEFLGLSIKKMAGVSLWHDAVMVMEVRFKETGALCGYILLDLLARNEKTTQAATSMIVPATISEKGIHQPAVVTVVAGLTPYKKENALLLPFSDVSTIFHECGHAFHALLGATLLPSQSGLNVVFDFLEMPSLMVEYWLKQSEILKKISTHYISRASMPDALIENVIKAHRFMMTKNILEQAYYSFFALELFNQKGDAQMIKKQLWQKIFPMIQFDPEDHFEATFGHLVDYGPKYYTYLWSNIFAADIFATIKTQGLMHPRVGAEYVKKILSFGGSRDPMVLVTSFLGRELSMDSFFKDLSVL